MKLPSLTTWMAAGAITLGSLAFSGQGSYSSQHRAKLGSGATPIPIRLPPYIRTLKETSVLGLSGLQQLWLVLATIA